MPARIDGVDRAAGELWRAYRADHEAYVGGRRVLDALLAILLA